MKMQTLTCSAGHAWTRPSQRGKPPKLCPEHKTELSTSAPKAKPAPAATVRYDALIDRALAALDNLYGEDVRMIDYITTQLSSGRRDESESAMLADRLTDIIRPRSGYRTIEN